MVKGTQANVTNMTIHIHIQQRQDGKNTFAVFYLSESVQLSFYDDFDGGSYMESNLARELNHHIKPPH